MKNTEKYIKTLEEWRNCPMANFICTVGIETKLETNMPRGRMLLLSLLHRGVRELDDYAVRRIYECCLCGLCTQCGFDDTDIPAAIAAGRADINEAGFMPPEAEEYVKKVQESCIWEDADIPALASKPVVFITYDQDNAEAFKKIAERAGIDAAVIVEGRYDSAVLYELGAWDVSSSYMDKINRLANNEKIKCVVIDSPHLWDRLKDNKKTVPFTEYIKQLIDTGSLKLKQADMANATYHDPCKLVRDTQDETTVRGILNAAGIELKEMKWNKKDAKCCGGATLKVCAPEISKKATDRRVKQAEDIGAEKMIVACNHCYENFMDAGPDFKIIKLIDLILGLTE